MSGFGDSVLNRSIVDSILTDIIGKVLVCCRMMVKDHLKRNEKIKNHEEVIRNVLHNDYLNDNDVRRNVGLGQFYFIPESPEAFVDGAFKRRADLKVISDKSFEDTDEYFIFECKRIDGTRTLNKAYLLEGIDRFIDENQPLYPSPTQRNCMFGFIVGELDVRRNVEKINDLQCEIKDETAKRNQIKPVEGSDEFSFVYQSSYELKKRKIKLYHFFHEFFEIVT